MAQALDAFGVTVGADQPHQVGQASWTDRRSDPRVVVQASEYCKESRHQVLLELSREGKVPAPLATRDGHHCLFLGDHHFAALPWVSGTVEWGRLSSKGRITALGTALRGIHLLTPQSLNSLTPMRGAQERLQYSIEDAIASYEGNGGSSSVALRTLRLKARLLAGRDGQGALDRYFSMDGLSHGDVHPGNIVWRGSLPQLIDWAQVRAWGQWYEIIRTSLWSIGPAPWLRVPDGAHLAWFGAAYSASAATNVDWETAVGDFITILLLDGTQLRSDASAREIRFGVNRWRMAQSLIAAENNYVHLFSSAFARRKSK